MNWKLKAALLVTITASLMACDSHYSKYCPSPVHPSDSARAWIRSKQPFPHDVAVYFDAVGKQQEVIEDNCGGATLWLP